jgi:hypothetical protein
MLRIYSPLLLLHQANEERGEEWRTPLKMGEILLRIMKIVCVNKEKVGAGRGRG